MGYTIIREEDPIPETSIVLVLYAPPGAGKSSLSFTADKPLHFDFDDGLKRAVKRKGSIKFDNWKDVIQFVDSKDFEDIDPKTLIFDTADTMLNDYIAHDVAREKGNKKTNGALTQSGYGAMKMVFDTFFNKFKGKKDIIFICHESEDKRDDKAVLRPKITGGAYQVVIQKADLIGYLDINTNSEGEKELSLDFNPSDTRYAKNFAEFPVIDIPHYSSPDFDGLLGNLIKQAKEKFSTMSEAQKEALDKVKEFTDRIESISNFDEYSTLLGEIASLSNIYKIQLKNELDVKLVGLWENEIKATKNMLKLDNMADSLNKLTNPQREQLSDTYKIVYSRHWIREKAEKAKSVEDYNALLKEISALNKPDVILKVNVSKKGLPSSLSKGLFEAAAEKGFVFNKALSAFEEAKKQDTKEEPKNDYPSDWDSPGKKGKMSPEEGNEKEAQYIKAIKAAKNEDELEPIEDLIMDLPKENKLRVMKVLNDKLVSLG